MSKYHILGATNTYGLQFLCLNRTFSLKLLLNTQAERQTAQQFSEIRMFADEIENWRGLT